MYMYGNLLAKSPVGTLGSGLGTTTSSGTHTIVDGNVVVDRDTVAGDEPQAVTVDGVELIFHFTSEAEAPAMPLVGRSPALNHMLELLLRAAPTSGQPSSKAT